MTNLLTCFIFMMGVITVVLSFWAASIFDKSSDGVRSSHKLSRALKWQLIGEGIIGIGTVIFAFAAHVGVLDGWSISTQSLLRFLMFFATSTTTLHLTFTVKRIQND